jgi:hypothetical protein
MKYSRCFLLQLLQIGTPQKNKNKQENQKPHQQQLQNLHYKRTEIRARAVGKKDDASLGSPRARQPTAKRSGASQQRATQKLSSLCVVRARLSLRAGEGATGTAGW